MIKFGIATLLSSALLSCVTGSNGPEYRESRVVERIGKAKETPTWAEGTVTMYEDGQDAIFTSIMTMSGDSRPEACLKAADLDSRSMMLRHIKDTLTASGQLNEVSASSDPGYEGLVAFLSQGKITGAKTTERYWEKAEESDTTGTRVLRLRCAVKVAVKKIELQRQMREATDVKSGNAEIRKKLLQAQGDFIESLNPLKKGDSNSENL
ncbi:MAG: hypothetical protein FJ146_20015 [Deltaproteobacteria bacterium]|nr:hypothetical protein [Deltaproteobacteria bacterium]